jgi:hypothetical protein
VLCNELGQSHGRVTLGYACAQLAVLLPMLLFYRWGFAWQLAWLLGCSTLFIVTSLHIRKKMSNQTN